MNTYLHKIQVKSMGTRRSLRVGIIGLVGMFLPTSWAATQGTFSSYQAFQSSTGYTPFSLTNLWIVIATGLIFIMHLGFATLETGLTRPKNTINILFKTVFIICMGVLVYAVWGFHAMYPHGHWLIPGLLALGHPIYGSFASPADQVAYLTSVYGSYTYWTDFLFQAMFAATAVTIVSGAVAERIRLGSFLILATVLGLIVYPITGSWGWGGGWMQEAFQRWFGSAFHDFAGSTFVHAFGGYASLAAVLVLGTRRGKYVDGQIRPIPGHNIPLAAIGVFVLFFGWFGFNGGSILSTDPAALSHVILATTIAGCMGGMTATFTSWILLRSPDLTMMLNGILAGLVGITAGADQISIWGAVIVGGIAGVIVVFAVLILDRIHVDDPVGAIPVHAVCGNWGTIAVGIFGSGKFLPQLLGTAAVSLFVFVSTLVVCWVLKAVIGLRVSEEEELEGLDLGEHGMEAYPYFQIVPER